MQAERLWQAALGQVQLEIPRASYETWVRDAELLAYEDGEFIVGVRNAYARDWLEGRLLATFKRILAGLADRTVGVRFVVWQDDATEGVPALVEASASAGASQSEANRRLNARYSFESFVVGSSNRLAHAAAQAVAESPARAYNPLFLYGGVGLGKNSLAARRRPRLYAVGLAGVVCFLGGVHERPDQRHPHAHHGCLQGALPTQRRTPGR